MFQRYLQVACNFVTKSSDSKVKMLNEREHTSFLSNISETLCLSICFKDICTLACFPVTVTFKVKFMSSTESA